MNNRSRRPARSACPTVRPCPRRRCRLHLWPDVQGKWLRAVSCVLDFVDEHPRGASHRLHARRALKEAGVRIEQIERSGLNKLYVKAQALGELRELREYLERGSWPW